MRSEITPKGKTGGVKRFIRQGKKDQWGKKGESGWQSQGGVKNRSAGMTGGEKKSLWKDCRSSQGKRKRGGYAMLEMSLRKKKKRLG